MKQYFSPRNSYVLIFDAAGIKQDILESGPYSESKALVLEHTVSQSFLQPNLPGPGGREEEE